MQILKLGGSAITAKEQFMKANKGNIAKLAKAIAKAWNSGVHDLIIVHGAGSFGHALVLKYKLDNGVRTMKEQEGCKKTQEACAELSRLVVGALLKERVPAVSIAPHSIIVSNNKRIEMLDESPIFDAIEKGEVPVLYGDMVMDSSLGFSVCSGDQIVAYPAKWADRVVMASAVDGVMADGKVVRLITKKNFAEVAKHLKTSDKPDVTGGMAGKIKEIMGMGKPAFVVNAEKPERVVALLLGKRAVCTEIRL
ncbi:MAG: isopentenyl phosphate kinase [Candidatus Anstonellaceae archaeon]